jgi:hypothetical protein
MRSRPSTLRRPTAVRLAVAAFGLAAFVAAGKGSADEVVSRPVPPIDRVVKTKPIDLVVCLDTSGSMQGLINAARQKIWEVVSHMATAKPTPTLRVALLTYGSPGHDEAGHVVLQTPLTLDLDLVSERLFALSTNGGEEYVGRVVHTALEKLSWSADDALKMIFVAGNESADQDQQVPFRQVVQRAARAGIRVNSIYCGNPDDEIAPGWREIATLGKGRFATIEKDTGTVAVATPFDRELSDLSGRLNTTYLGYGAKAEEGRLRQSAQDSNAGGVGAPAAAERAAAKASGLYSNSAWDLVDKSGEKDFDLGKIEAKDLPEEMQKLSLDERRAYLEKKKAERADLQRRIHDLNAKRVEFVKSEMAKKGLDDSKALDRALRDAITEQAAEKGFTLR